MDAVRWFFLGWAALTVTILVGIVIALRVRESWEKSGYRRLGRELDAALERVRRDHIGRAG